MANRRETRTGPKGDSSGARHGLRTASSDAAEPSRGGRRPFLLRTGPTIVVVFLLGGCAVGNHAKEQSLEVAQSAPPRAASSATIQRLPPVSPTTDVRSLAATNPVPPKVSLGFRPDPSPDAPEAPKAAASWAPSAMPDRGDRAPGDASPSQPVAAVYQEEARAAADHRLQAQPIWTEWRDWPGAVVKASGEELSGESLATDGFGGRDRGPMRVQFLPVEAPQPRPTELEVLPPPPERDALPPVQLRCDDIDVRKALEMLSREASVSILVAPGVTGRVTANLQGLSFEEALGAILKLCKLVAQRENDLIFVYPLADVPQLNRRLRAFPLDYVSATDALPGVTGLLSPTGKAFQTQSSPEDNRKAQNVIVVDDLPDYLLRVEEYLTAIDRPPRQVLIEVHVLQIDLEDERRHGVNFEHIMNIMGNAARLQLSGLADPLAAQAFYINVDGANLEALVECLKTTTDAKTLASPKVLVLNGQEARIQIGEQLGYQVITTTETSSMEEVKFLDVGVVLDVMPYISRDNQVVLHVKPEVSSGRINPETNHPEKETTEVETDVLLMDGQGMVIGGLIQERDSNVQSKIPLLGDIWLIGRLFQRRELVKSRSEIIVTLMPRVLPYLPEYELQDQVDTARAATPLTYGPLCRYPRPWEPRLPDTEWRLRDLRCRRACRPVREM